MLKREQDILTTEPNRSLYHLLSEKRDQKGEMVIKAIIGRRISVWSNHETSDWVCRVSFDDDCRSRSSQASSRKRWQRRDIFVEKRGWDTKRAFARHTRKKTQRSDTVSLKSQSGLGSESQRRPTTRCRRQNSLIILVKKKQTPWEGGCNNNTTTHISTWPSCMHLLVLWCVYITVLWLSGQEIVDVRFFMPFLRIPHSICTSNTSLLQHVFPCLYRKHVKCFSFLAPKVDK